MTQISRAVLGQVGEEPLGHALEPPRVLRRDGVPELGLAVVEVVDGVEIHVLCVPCEGRLPHAKVEVRGVDPVDLDVVVAVHPVQDRPQALDVPFL